MSASVALVARLQADSLHGVAAVIDRGLRLKRGAVHNAAQAVSADLVNARARAEAGKALNLARGRELSLRRA